MTLRPIIPMFSQPKPAGNLFKQVKIKAKPLSIKYNHHTNIKYGTYSR